MVVSSPQQEIYLLCLRDAARLFDPGYPNGDPKVVYDYLPIKEVKYPFVFIGEAFDLTRALKDGRMGDVTQTIHFFHDEPHQRKKVSDMIETLRNELYREATTQNYFISLARDRVQMSWDNSTSSPLIHGVLEMEFNYCF